MDNEYNIKYLKVATNPEIRPVSSKSIPRGELPKGILQRDGTRKQPIITSNKNISNYEFNNLVKKVDKICNTLNKK